MKKDLFFALSTLLILVSFSGCGDDDINDPENMPNSDVVENPDSNDTSDLEVVDASTTNFKFFILSNYEAEVTGLIK